MEYEYQWEDGNHPKLTELRIGYNLNEVVSAGKTEYDQQILLKEWVHGILPRGKPEEMYYDKSALEILEDARNGKKMYCTQYAFTYVQCALALGWQSRKLSIDWDHEIDQKDRHHGIADVWSETYNKWYSIDPENNLHFEKEGRPLSALEVRMEWLQDFAADVTGVIGNNKEDVRYDKESYGHDTPSNYFWIFTSLRNNFFAEPGLFSTKGYIWIDTYNEAKKWYRNDPAIGEPQIHSGYSYQFVPTTDSTKLYPAPTKS